MRNTTFFAVWLGVLLAVGVGGHASDIVVVDVDTEWHSSPTQLPIDPEIEPPRWLVEYANTIYHDTLDAMPGEFAGTVDSRTLVEYANTIYHDRLEETPAGLNDRASQVVPRIIVVGAQTGYHQPLIPMNPAIVDFAATPSNTSVDLTWVNERSGELPWTLVVCSQTRIDWRPEDGTAYSLGEEVDAGVKVCHISADDHSTTPVTFDNIAPRAPYHFAAFAFNTAHEYSVGSYISINTTHLTGDVSGDGQITAYDAALILQYVAGLITVFPIDTFTTPVGSAPQHYVLHLPQLRARAGESIEVPIQIDRAPVWAGAFAIEYDPNVIEAVQAQPTMTLSGAYWKANVSLPGQVRLAFASPTVLDGDGKLFTIAFKVRPQTVGQESPITFASVELGGSLSTTKYNGFITVIPDKTVLLQNYPNPFNPETWLPYHLASDGQVQMHIYNARGSLVRTLALGFKSAGVYTTHDRAAYWDGRDELGQRVSSGIYFYTLQADGVQSTRRMIILK